MDKRIPNNMLIIQELCDEHNKLRKNPECYIGLLQKVLQLIRRSNILHLENEMPFKTIEGKVAVLEAINYLSNFPKSLKDKLSNHLLTVSEYLCQASLDHAKDLGINGTCSHIGTSDNSHMNTRVEKYCDWKGGLAESLDFGTINVQNIMIKLLICDGDKKRAQRQYIFDPGFLYFGAGFYYHTKYKKCSVISYAGFIQSKEANFSEKELINNYLNIHKYFINRNKDEFEKYLEKIKNKENNEKEYKKYKKEEIVNENNIKESINNIKEEKINTNNNENEKVEHIKEIKNNNDDKKDNKKEGDNNSLINNLNTIEEVENDHEKEYNNKIVVINENTLERYGVQIKETIYKIKEGNYHIVEEEINMNNFNILNNF